MKKDYLSGLIIILTGLFFSIYTYLNYDIGSMRRIGPGFFPLFLGLILTTLGIFYLLKNTDNEFRYDLKKIKPYTRSFIFIILSIFIFYITLSSLGFFLSVFISSMTACFASSKHNSLSAISTSFIITVVTFFIFKVALQLAVPMWPTILETL